MAIGTAEDGLASGCLVVHAALVLAVLVVGIAFLFFGEELGF